MEAELGLQRRKVDFDTNDIVIREIVSMLEEGDIQIAPAYQRPYRWQDVRASQLIESLFLGIPVPSIFMATNDNAKWEVVDGLQRLTAVVKFCGTEKARNIVKQPQALRLSGLEKLQSFNGLTFTDLPEVVQRQFRHRAFKIVNLNEKSDKLVRFDLFERLNRGGILLSAQEIRDCVIRGIFADLLDSLSKDDSNFRHVVRLKADQERDATRAECVLRFFAFLYDRDSFKHLVDKFLTAYMVKADRSFDYKKGKAEFGNTFSHLMQAFPDGIRRANRKSGVTSLVLYEGISVGAALALREAKTLNTKHISEWLGHPLLRQWTTGATNNRPAVDGRINFCRDRFLGIPAP